MDAYAPRLDADIREDELRDLEKLAWWLDSAFRVPGTNLRFGFDGLIGLVPGLGDVAPLLASLWIVHRGRQLGARPVTLARMLWNVVVDMGVGAVPVVGDLFDFAWKANRRNIALLTEDFRRDPELARGRRMRARHSGRLTTAAMAAAAVLIPTSAWAQSILTEKMQWAAMTIGQAAAAADFCDDRDTVAVMRALDRFAGPATPEQQQAMRDRSIDAASLATMIGGMDGPNCEAIRNRHDRILAGETEAVMREFVTDNAE